MTDQSPSPDTITDIAVRQALKDFVDWLYEQGPDANSVPREKLLAAYIVYRGEQAVRRQRLREIPRRMAKHTEFTTDVTQYP